MKKSKCPYSPLAIDSGRVADLPFIGILINFEPSVLLSVQPNAISQAPQNKLTTGRELVSEKIFRILRLILSFFQVFQISPRSTKCKEKTTQCGRTAFCKRDLFIDMGTSFRSFFSSLSSNIQSLLLLPVMNLLDRNLEKLREQMDVFKPATVFYIAMETMSALAVRQHKLLIFHTNKQDCSPSTCVQFLHSHKYIHRDVKLTNICIGAGQAITRIFLIDYGDTVKSGKKIR